MLTLQSLARELLRVPRLTLIGVAILILGGIADVTAHVTAIEHAGHLHEHTGPEAAAHLIGFVGMVVTLLGVLLEGVRQSISGRRAGTTKGGI
jgi:hypothetical protein